MSHSNGVISSPVQMVADVKAVLGESVNTLSGLCTSSKVNMWSKVKPQKTSTNMGLTPKLCSTLAAVISATTGGNNGWTWNKPTGSYTLKASFDGYNHNAACPVTGLGLSATSIAKGATLTVYANSTGSTTTNIGISDIFGTIYFGALIASGSTAVIYATATTKLTGDDELSVDLPTSSLSAGTYKVYPFLSTAVTSSSNSVSATFYTVPGCTALSLTVTATAIDVTVLATKSGTKWTITVTYYKNASTASDSYSNCTIMLRDSSKAYNDATVVGEQSKTGVTLTAGTAYTVTFTSSLTTDNAAVWVNIPGANYRGKHEVGADM